MEERYNRQIRLAEVGLAGQAKLQAAKVLVVGAGGLGCPALQYLAAAGVGTLGIVDFDQVTQSNLHRQILFEENDLGKNKAKAAKEQLQKHNSTIVINDYETPFDSHNGLALIAAYDIVIDATDNFETRYCINDCCVLSNKPMIYAALYKFQGQVAVFNYKNGPTYRCLFPSPPQIEEVPTCETVGVLGVVPGFLGVLQATESLKIILGLNQILSGKVLCYDLLTHQMHTLQLTPNRKAIVDLKQKNELIEAPQLYCLSSSQIGLEALSGFGKFIWVDVREPLEHPQLDLPNVIKMPLSSLDTRWVELQHEEPKVLFCQSGQRSKKAVELLLEKGIKNSYALQEGAAAISYWNQKKKHEQTD